jgi:hypothetical protein
MTSCDTGKNTARLSVVLLSISAIALSVAQMRADSCTPPATAGADNITCQADGNADNTTFSALAGDDTVDIVSGVFAGGIDGDAGADTITLDGGTLGSVIFGGADADTIDLLSGTVFGVSGDAGADTITLDGATVTTDILGGDDNDTINLLSGTFGGNLLGGDGSDDATIVSTFSLASITGDLDGGDDVSTADGFIDVLTIGASGTLTGESLINWERINVDSATLALDGASLVTSQEDGFGLFVRFGGTVDLDGDFAITGDVTIDATSTVIANGDSPGMNTIDGDLTLAGLLDLTDDAPDDQTDVTGDLIGEGGTIALDVSFAPGGPVESDLVTFGDDLTGTAFVSVNPVASGMAPGAPPLITFGGVDLADIELLDPLFVDGLGYDLEKIGDSYLLALDGAVSEEVVGALALSAAFAPINRDLFGDLGARIGTGDALRRPGMADGGAGLWARGGVTYHDGEAGEGTATVDFDMTHFFVQLGVDAFRAETAGGAIVGAVMVQYGNADGDADQDSVGPSTDFDITSYGVGIGATWYSGSSDFYVDATGMVNWHDVDVANQDTDAMSYAIGLEAGTHFAVGDTLSIAPMGQLVYSRADMDNLSLPSVLNGSDSVSIEDPESLEARAIVMLELDVGDGSSVQFGGGLAYEMLGESTTQFGNGTKIDTDFGGLSGEVAARGQFRISETVTAFGDLRGRKAFGSDGVDSFGGLIGIRFDF